MKQIFSFITAMLVLTVVCHAQANTKLSNLVAPTAVNVNLIPGGTTGTKDIGSNTKRWRNGYYNASVYAYGVGSSYGVYGTAGTYGLYGLGGSYGVFGSGTSYGVYGTSSSGYGVVGSSGYIGTYGSGSSYGLYGVGGTYGAYASGSSYGVYGNSSSGYGVAGISSSGYGLYGSSTSSWGSVAYGVYGAYGSGTSGYGLEGVSSSSYGVYGYSSNSYGGYFYSPVSYGIRAGTGNSGGFYAAVFDGSTYTFGSNYTSSDRNLKRNIKDFGDAMSIINKLQPKNYEFKTDEKYASLNLATGTHYGLLAQDLEQVLPNLVHETPFELNSNLKQQAPGPDAAKAESGKKEMMNIKGVNYTELIPIMIKAMQELSKQNDDLKNQVSTLTATVSQLTKSTGVVSASTASINQNFPNPFTKSTVISFNVPQGSNANIIVSQTGSGKVIKAIPLSAGTSQLTFDGVSLAAGSYSYSLYIDGKKIDTKQMIINK